MPFKYLDDIRIWNQENRDQRHQTVVEWLMRSGRPADWLVCAASGLLRAGCRMRSGCPPGLSVFRLPVSVWGYWVWLAGRRRAVAMA